MDFKTPRDLKLMNINKRLSQRTNFEFNKMADSSGSDSEFEGFTREDLGENLQDDDSDIDFFVDLDDYVSSDDEESLPLGELRDRILLGSGLVPEDLPNNETGETTVRTTRIWSKNLTPISVDRFSEETGPTVTLTPDKTEIDFFNLIFSPDLYTILVDQTNLYARQCQQQKVDSKWIPVTVVEMQAFLGMHVLMSFLHLPSYKDYWTTNYLFKIPSIPVIMTRSRFEKILQYFHCNDNTTNPKKGEPGHDKLHPIRLILETVQRNLKGNYNLSKNVAVDEAMIPFRGRLSYRQYLPAKPCKFGIKVWELADSANGYVHEMQIYTGKSETGRTETGLASRVVIDLTRDLVGKNHHVYMDNFFSSPALFTTLLDDKIYAAGTVRTNRKGWPQQFHPKCLSKKDKGVSKSLQDGNLVATCWMDNRQVNLLSTNSDPSVTVQMKRKQRDGSRMDIPAPEVVAHYSENMNAVDHGDQLRMQYPTCRKSKKYWKYIFWFLFDTALACAFILKKESPNHKKTSRNGKAITPNQLDFRKSISTALIGKFQQKRRYQITPSDQAGRSHWPSPMPKAQRCKHCLLSHIRKQSMYGCQICDVNLCVTCFEPYHKSKSMEE